EVKAYFACKKGKWYRKLENEFEDRRKEEEQKMMLQKEERGILFV
ncbi:transposase, partial [Bacillus thuringiensis]